MAFWMAICNLAPFWAQNKNQNKSQQIDDEKSIFTLSRIDFRSILNHFTQKLRETKTLNWLNISRYMIYLMSRKTIPLFSVAVNEVAILIFLVPASRRLSAH